MFTRSILLARYICLVETWILFFMIHKLENHINIMEFNILDVLRLHKSFFNLIFHVFQDPCFSGSGFPSFSGCIFFWLQVFLSPGFSGSVSRVRVQALQWIQGFQGPVPGFGMDPSFSGSGSRFWK